MKTIKYRPEIDGLRAVAVLPVVLYHAGFSIFSGGYVGVDIFFVISGFLISTIIIKNFENGSFSYSNFYENRLRRIFPALFFLLFTCSIFSIYFLPPYYLSQLGQSLTATSVFIANFLFWWEDGYFDFASEYKPLLHMWSLGVEEQFYILIPILILISLSRKSKNFLSTMMITLFFLSLFYSCFEVVYERSRAFFLLPSRFWELAMGSICAIYLLKNNKSNKKNILEVISLLLILIPVLYYDKNTIFPSFAALPPTLGAAGIILFSTKETLVGKILSLKPIVFVGLISYSLYLWHVPIISISNFIENDFFKNKYLLVILAFLMSYLSYRYIEQPFRNKQFLNQKLIFNMTIFGIIFFSILGISIYKGHLNFVFNERESIKNNKFMNLYKKEINTFHSFQDDCKINKNNFDQSFYENLDKCIEKKGEFDLIFGDSHSIGLTNIFHLQSDRFIVGVGLGGCRLNNELLSECSHYQNVIELIKKYNDNIKSIIFHVSGAEDYTVDYNGYVGTIAVFDEGKSFNIHKENIASTIDFLKNINIPEKTYWIGPYHEPQIDITLTILNNDSLSFNPNSLNALHAVDNEIKKQMQAIEGITYYSLIDDLGESGKVLYIDNCITFRDRDHFSSCGEKIISKKLNFFNLLESQN